ncbi:MAG TPA: SatD family protein [Gemmatimonadales bacterium]|nr:SatD family protein [Gemmatimonadales bacterium]
MVTNRPRTIGTSKPGFSKPRLAIALIADLVASRLLNQKHRTDLQKRLEALLGRINENYQEAIGADFLITLGDEFQGVITNGEVVPSIIWDIETELRGVDVRIAFGFGMLNPPFKRVALGMDGPAFHRAREALELWPKRHNKGGVFSGFNEDDAVLNGFARILRYVRERLTPAQVRTLSFLRRGGKQIQVAGRLGVTRQVISRRVRRAGLEAYMEAEHGWRQILKRYDLSNEWRRG